MKTFDPFPQSSDGGVVMNEEWQDETPPVGASRRAQRVVRGFGKPVREPKASVEGRAAGGTSRRWGKTMNLISSHEPDEAHRRLRFIVTIGCIVGIGFILGPQGDATTDPSCKQPPPEHRRIATGLDQTAAGPSRPRGDA